MRPGFFITVVQRCKIIYTYFNISLARAEAGDIIKVLKSDAVDILFWLTIYDTLSIHDVILKNVARSLRCFSYAADSSRILVKQERFFSVLKALIKSKNEDVLWQTAAVLYNLMQVDVCTKILLDKGLISYIFDLAASNYNSVRHVCSACLHLIPNSMPNMDDQGVLQLVLCLLEADGEKFAQLGERPTDVLPYNSMVEKTYAGSLFKHGATGFSPSWHVLTCAVESTFYPSLIFEPDESNIEIPTAANKGGGEHGSPVNGFEAHEKIQSNTYNDFQKEAPPPASSIGGDSSSVSLSTPALASKVPPSYEGKRTSKGDLENDNPTRFSATKESGVTDGDNTNRSITFSRSKLPLIQPPKSLPENTIDAINKSISRKHQTTVQQTLSSPLLSSTQGSTGLSGKGLPPSVLKSAAGHPFVTLNQYGNNVGK